MQLPIGYKRIFLARRSIDSQMDHQFYPDDPNRSIDLRSDNPDTPVIHRVNDIGVLPD